MIIQLHNINIISSSSSKNIYDASLLPSSLSLLLLSYVHISILPKLNVNIRLISALFPSYFPTNFPLKHVS